MNGKHKEGESNQDSGQQPAKGGGSGMPPYDFYRAGVVESQGGLFSSLCQFLKDRSNSTVVVIVAIIALGYVAGVFVKDGDANYVKLIGGITLGVLIFILGLLALLKAIRYKSGTNTEKRQRGSVESGSGQGCKEADGDIEGSDQRGESDRGCTQIVSCL
jgi:hypothetical protein